MSFVRIEELLAACPYVDAVLLGEGEEGAGALLEGAANAAVPGLVHRTAGGAARNRLPQTVSLKGLHPPDFSPLPLGAAFNPRPVLPVLYSRGCRWRRCSFCAHNLSFAGYRRKHVSAFVTELEGYVASAGARDFYLADQYVEAADLEAIAREILSRGLRLSWHVMGRPTAEFTPERCRLLFEAGCRWVSWGVETGSQRLLDLVEKATETRVVKDVLAASAKAGISNLAMMIFGLPTSADRDLRETFAFLEEVHEHVDAMTASVFTLWEGTRFARNAARHGLEVVGSETLLRAGGLPIRSLRLEFQEVAEDGSFRSPRGLHEVGLWEERRRWLGGAAFLEGLPSEHYLLYAAGRASASPSPRRPVPGAA
jgi:radical SAM superfamily enzyme YgiQ (UPF0313 family)